MAIFIVLIHFSIFAVYGNQSFTIFVVPGAGKAVKFPWQFLPQRALCNYYTTRLQNVNFRDAFQGIFQENFCIWGIQKYDIILLDPPYAEVFLENALKQIAEIDILQSGGIIVAERPLEKELPWEFEGFTRSRDYKYGKTLLAIYRKE